MLTEMHRTCLKEALAGLLGGPLEGAMAYVRCLPHEVVAALSANPLELPGWDVYAVGGAAGVPGTWITSDRAVELREEKRGSILLLIDRDREGAGLSGIYSAVREISEGELLGRSQDAALSRLWGKRRSVRGAFDKATRIGKRRVLSPWQQFDFYALCAEEPSSIGRHVAVLGLWPIATEAELTEDDLTLSVRVVEKLLLTSGAANTPRIRVDSLLLDGAPSQVAEQTDILEAFLRRVEGFHWTEAVSRVVDEPDLWLNRIRPGFSQARLKKVNLEPWRGKSGKALKWSGLTPEGGEYASDAVNHPLEFIIPVQESETARLEVRWKTEPQELPAGAVEYLVEVLTGTVSKSTLASQTVVHSGKGAQRCVFTRDDFQDLPEGGKWEAMIRLRPVDGTSSDVDDADGQSDTCRLTEEFALTFGEVPKPERSGVGKKTRALVDEAIRLSPEEFAQACTGPVKETGGYVGITVEKRTVMVWRPSLLRGVERDWEAQGFSPGRWQVRVRDDGSPVNAPKFVPIGRGDCEERVWQRLLAATRTLGTRAKARGGFVGLIAHGLDAVDDYVNAWAAALEGEQPQLCLAHTVEVQSLSGSTLGLVVLPSHPVRVAWHQAYDELAYHARYEQRLKPAAVVKTLAPLDGAYCPTFLPGLGSGETFVFGDMVGFHCVVMISHDEQEPQAAIARIARCVSSSRADTVPLLGGSTSEAVAREIDRYCHVHREYERLRVNALRPGDGMSVARALGAVLRLGEQKADDEEYGHQRDDALRGFDLSLFPSERVAQSGVVGRFLTEAAERRRAGAGDLEPEDRWMLETYSRAGVALPRLTWAKRAPGDPIGAAHVSIGFDTFDSCMRVSTDPGDLMVRPSEVYGLCPSLVRTFSFEPAPTWKMTLAERMEGEKHPAGRGLTERLLRTQTALARATAAHLGCSTPGWPVLHTEIDEAKAQALRCQHELSDWVVTVDRNVGLEYFDAPREAPRVYDAYVIDCIPERQDLDCVRLITSTSHVDEVTRLLDRALVEMGLSDSPHNCDSLLNQLKAVSGRLAMRLTHQGNTVGELVALAILHANCAASNKEHWLDITEGFLVPLDDIRDLILGYERNADEGASDGETRSRADLVYVSCPRRGGMQFTFIEVKYRRQLRTARQGDLLTQIATQTAATRRRWMDAYFSEELKPVQLAVRRKRLARALRFYLEKGKRHSLGAEAYKRLSLAIDRLYQLDSRPAVDEVDDRGFVFCPEYLGNPVEIDFDGQTRTYLFGPDSATRAPAAVVVEASTTPPQPIVPHEDTIPAAEPSAVMALAPVAAAEGDAPGSPMDAHPHEKRLLLLGETLSGRDPVHWEMSIRDNPHLMIVGKPGMGKTTGILNLCVQLAQQGVVPIVFSYHPDLENGLARYLGEPAFIDVDHGLGFNPMRVVGSGVHAWVDSVGMLRDMFSAIYPDLGERQTNEIREAIKRCYTDEGYGIPGSDDTPLSVPQFQRFYKFLKGNPRTHPGILARLSELDDYGLFHATTECTSPLESQRPVVVRLHQSQNEAIQKFVSSFALLSIYQAMHLRGEQPDIRHVIVFDEAHKASRLKLLPTMAKECRKFGLTLVVASQEAKDFDASLFAAIDNYLVLRVADTDAIALARATSVGEPAQVVSRLKQMSKYQAAFLTAGKRPAYIQLRAPETAASVG